MVTIILPSYRMSSSDKLSMFMEGANDPLWFHIFYVSYSFFYLLLILRNNQLHKQTLQTNNSSTNVEYHLLINRFILVSGILSFCLPIAFSLGYFEIDAVKEELVRKILFVLFSFTPLLFFIRFFVPVEINPFDTGPITNTLEKDEKTILNQWELLKTSIINEKPFLDQSLTLTQLSKLSGIGRTELSRLINLKSGNNFYDFINHYRLQYFIERIKNGDHRVFSLETIALECGFKSYTSFYRVFKRTFNQSPKEYIKKMN
ncbi:MAG: helix-turn-helix domain-containing protein [Bacteroidota bacterium]